MEATPATALGRLIRRHWWVVCVGVLAGIAGGAVTVAASAPVFSSSTSVLVQPVGADGANVNLQTEAQLARSTEAALAAAALLGDRVPPSPPAVDVLDNSSVLVIRFEARTPPRAQAGARAFAKAYLANRADAATAAINEQIAALTRRIDESDAEVAVVNARIAELSPSSPELANLASAKTTLTIQITSLTSRVNDLATTTVNPGRVIQDAPLPSAPVRPNGWLHLALASGLGFVAGGLAALTRQLFSVRVRNGTDVARHAGVTLLAELVDDAGLDGGFGVLSPRHPGGRAFNRLRNEVVAALGPEERLILVTGASPGSASTVVAANLAAALARADSDVVLVGANVPELGVDALTLSRLFDVGDVPGLTDVLCGRASLAAAVQRAARSPRLRVVTPGGTATAAGLLQSEGVRSALQDLRRQARFVVVEAPSAASGADAQSLARVADAAILVVEAGRARHAEVADAAVQIRLVGARLLGAVVLPRVASRARGDEQFRPMHRADELRELSTETWQDDPRAADAHPDSRPGFDTPTTALRVISDHDPASAQNQT